MLRFRGKRNRMASIKYSIDTKGIEKALKKELEKVARQEQLIAEVEAQPDIGGVRMLDKAGEEALRIILEHYDGNNELSVTGSATAFPAYMRLSVGATLDKLKASGLLGYCGLYIGGDWRAYLTPNALTYFEDKERYLERNCPMFQKLPSNAKALLDEILAAEDAAQLLCDKFEVCTEKEDSALRAIIRDLTGNGYIRIQWADNVPYIVEINNSARTYVEQEAEHERRCTLGATTYNIGNISGSNVVLGNAVNSTLSIDASIQRIQDEIAEKGGDDKEVLLELLEEAKEIIENLNASRQVPKNKGFWNRLTSHLEKHGWFYGEIVGFLGAAVIALLSQ